MRQHSGNLTEGKPIRLILAFAVPVFLGNLFQILYGLIDTKIVGSTLGEEALAAVGSVSTLYNLLTGFFNGMTLGFSVITARCFGAGDEERLKKSVAASILIGFAAAAVLVLGIFAGLSPILTLLHVPGRQEAMAYSYISILVLGMFVTLAYNLCANILRSIGDAVTPLVFLVLASAVNVFLDYLLILAFQMGVAGAAVATVISQLLSVVLCILHIRRKFPVLWVEKRHFRSERAQVKTLLTSGLSMGMMSSLVNFGTLILQTGINTLGTSVIVAHTAARKVFEIWGLPVSVLGATMATYSGQNFGAGKYRRIREGLLSSLAIGTGWSALVFVMAHTISSYLIAFIASTQSKEILYWGETYLKYNMSFQVVCVFIVILRNTLQGIGDYVTPIVSSCIELAGKILFTLVFVRLFGYWGVIWTEPVSWLVMVLPLGLQVFRNPVLRRKKGETSPGERG